MMETIEPKTIETKTIKVAEPAHGWRFEIPSLTPSGQLTEVDRHDRKGMFAAHAHSADRFELYFELVSFAERLDHAELIRKQQQFIEDAYTEVAFKPVKSVTAFGQQALSFQFSSVEKTRRFLIVDSASRTYRLVINPLSPLNEVVLASVNLGP